MYKIFIGWLTRPIYIYWHKVNYGPVCRLVQCQGNRPPLIDPSAAKELFQQVDRAGSNDGNLTLMGLKELFDEFDANGENCFKSVEKQKNNQSGKQKCQMTEIGSLAIIFFQIHDKWNCLLPLQTNLWISTLSPAFEEGMWKELAKFAATLLTQWDGLVWILNSPFVQLLNNVH